LTGKYLAWSALTRVTKQEILLGDMRLAWIVAENCHYGNEEFDVFSSVFGVVARGFALNIGVNADF
jgi:hypothetical protein